VGRSGDELDRLAENLNAMLERIEALDGGAEGSVRQHRARSEDPLTRLRNRAEEALAKAGNEPSIALRWSAPSRNPTA